MLVAQDFVSGKAKPRLPEGNYRLVFLIFAIFGVYVVALPWLGYRIATFFFCVTLQARLDPPASPRKWAIVVGAALATTFVTYYLFEGYLQVLLPRGRWTAF
jgi:hypothetical protein